MRVDDETLIAFADGELSAAERTQVEEALAADPGLRERLEAQQRLRTRLCARYDPVAEEPVPDRLRAMLETNLVDFGAARAARTRPIWQSFAALAATLVLGLFLGQSLSIGGGAPVASEDGMLFARGNLGDALDTQLASAQPEGAATRIGVSFADDRGRLCRTFEAGGIAGLACRADRDWQLMMTAAADGGSRAQYRQAGGASVRVLEAAQEMMAGTPLDAEAERRARDSGWRAVPTD